MWDFVVVKPTKPLDIEALKTKINLKDTDLSPVKIDNLNVDLNFISEIGGLKL